VSGILEKRRDVAESAPEAWRRAADDSAAFLKRACSDVAIPPEAEIVTRVVEEAWKLDLARTTNHR